jgi:hypothetical protein
MLLLLSLAEYIGLHNVPYDTLRHLFILGDLKLVLSRKCDTGVDTPVCKD